MVTGSLNENWELPVKVTDPVSPNRPKLISEKPPDTNASGELKLRFRGLLLDSAWKERTPPALLKLANTVPSPKPSEILIVLALMSMSCVDNLAPVIETPVVG